MGNGQIKINSKKAQKIFFELRPLLDESPHRVEYYNVFGRGRGAYKVTDEGIARNYVRKMCEDASEYAQKHGIPPEELPSILQAFRNNGGSIR